MHSFIPPAVVVLSVICTVSTAACTPGAVTDGDRPDNPGDTTTSPDTNVVQRGTLSVQVSIDAADASVATAAGVATSGLTVKLKRTTSTAPEQTLVTPASGLVKFEGLLAGSYQISVDRPLTPSEISQLPASERDATIFSGATSITIAPPSAETRISLVAARRGSLVISEVYIYAATGAAPFGNNGHYMEIYNNGDTTAYLDGLLFFRTSIGLHYGRTGSYPCSVNESWRMDDSGIWANTIEQFPGTGREVAVRPGESKMWALNAIDHRPVGNGMLDLRTATFESIGTSVDPDNPGAVNMLRFRVSPGLFYGPPFIGNTLVGLALPLVQDTTQMERALLTSYVDGSQHAMFKIPREAVLDAVGLRPTPEVENGPSGYPDQVVCEPFTSPFFERSEARLVDFRVPLAISRKSLGRTAAGNEILQRTRTGSRDFELAPPLRRTINRPPQ